jgi:membrane fusion protein (multidrug efflux system)
MKFAIVLATGMVMQCLSQTALGEEVDPVHEVVTTPVVSGDVSQTLNVYGQVSFDDAWLQNISVAYGGQVVRLAVLVGEPVARGQVLAEIAVDPAAATTYQQAQSALHFAESEVTRIKQLLADQLATTSQLAAAEKALADSRSQFQQLRTQGLGSALHLIKADYDAVIASVVVQPGERIPAGTTLMQLGNPNRLKVILGVEAEDVRWVQSGQVLELHPALAPDLHVNAVVDKVLHTVNPRTRLVDVLVRLNAEQTQPFLPGMTVSAKLSARRFHDATIVPRSSLMIDAGGVTCVMKVADARAVRVPVQVLLEQDDIAVVQGELSAGEQVVGAGLAEITDGASVRVVPAK